MDKTSEFIKLELELSSTWKKAQSKKKLRPAKLIS